MQIPSDERAALDLELQRVRQKLPGLVTRSEDLLEHLQRAGVSPSPAPKGRRLFELCLALDCARGRQEAIEVFVGEYRRPTLAAWRSARVGDAELGELWQSLLIHLLVVAKDSGPRILRYSGRGSLGGWVRITAIRFASAHRRTPVPDRDELLAMAVLAGADASPEASLLEARFSPAFRGCFRAALASLPAESSVLLRQAFVHGMTTRSLATAYGVHHTSIGRRLAKVRAALLNATKDLLASHLDVPVGDVESILAALHSRLDISFSMLARRED